MIKLYKYRSINPITITSLFEGGIYCSSPDRFNDPLDCKPEIYSTASLERIEMQCREIVRKVKGNSAAKMAIEEAVYYSSEIGDYKKSTKAKKYYRQLLINRAARSFEEKMGKRGVFCLSDKCDDVLMWSHYADNHTGICIEYKCNDLNIAKKIVYSANRKIDLRTVYNWIVMGDKESEKSVWSAQYLTKGLQWSYENEYRFVGEKSGVMASPFRTTGIIMGMNCSTAIEAMMVKSFHDVEGIRLYRMRDSRNSFKLKRVALDQEAIDETLALGVNPNRGFEFANLLRRKS